MTYSRATILRLALGACLVIGAAGAQVATAANFTGASYPVNLHGEQPAGGPHIFSVGGGEVECNTATFSGELPFNVDYIVLRPNYGNHNECEAFGSLGASVTTNGCGFLLFSKGETEIFCGTGKEITYLDNLGICTMHVKPQAGIKAVTYASNGNHIDLTFAATNIHAVVTGAFCPVGSKTYANATYSGKVTLKGNGGTTKIDVN